MQTSAILRDRDPSKDMQVLARIYFDLKGIEMWNKTVGLVGFGAIGRKVSERLLPFGSQLVAYDPYVNEDVMAKYHVRKVDLDTLMKESDFVSIHVMPNDSNRGMVGDSDIFSMAVNPRNPEVVYASACSGVYRSGNRAESWVRLRPRQGSPNVRAQIVTIDPTDPDHATAGPFQRPHDVQDGGLARPGGADDCHQFAPPNGKGYSPEGGHRGLLTIDLGHPVQFQNCFATHIDGTTT